MNTNTQNYQNIRAEALQAPRIHGLTPVFFDQMVQGISHKGSDLIAAAQEVQAHFADLSAKTKSSMRDTVKAALTDQNPRRIARTKRVNIIDAVLVGGCYGKIEATVQDRNVYTVKAVIQADRLECKCTCIEPTAHGMFCTHTIAVLKRWLSA